MACYHPAESKWLADSPRREPRRPGRGAEDLAVRSADDTFFKHGLGLKLVSENPAAGVKPVRLTQAIPVYLDEQEIISFLQAAATYDEWVRPKHKLGSLIHDIFVTYLKTGMRLEELRHLEWSDVDLHRGEISIRAKKEVRTKRTISLPPDLIASLRTLSAECFDEMGLPDRKKLLRTLRLRPKALAGLVYDNFELDRGTLVREFATEWPPKSTGRIIPISQNQKAVLLRQSRMENLVFPDPVVGGLWRLKINRLVQRCAQQANVNKPIHTHSLRHTFATQLRRKGVPLETLQNLLGHADIRDTLIYAHFSPTEAQAAIPKIDFF
jgi:integrase